jgi:hypothetical protein
MCRARLAGVLLCQREQRVADAAALMIGRYEQLGQKSQVAADPTEREADDFAGLLRYPQAIRIVAQRERFKPHRTPVGDYRPEAVPFGEMIDTPRNQFLCRIEVLLTGGSVVE